MPATLWVMAISLPWVMVFDLSTSAADDGLLASLLSPSLRSFDLAGRLWPQGLPSCVSFVFDTATLGLPSRSLFQDSMGHPCQGGPLYWHPACSTPKTAWGVLVRALCCTGTLLAQQVMGPSRKTSRHSGNVVCFKRTDTTSRWVLAVLQALKL